MNKTWKIIIAVIAVLAAAALIVGIVLGVKAGRRGEFKTHEDSIAYFYSDTEGMTRFIANGELLEAKLGGHVDSFLTCDGTVGIARAGTGLYLVDKSSVTKVYPAGVDRALLSLDGNVIVFTTATEVHIYDRRTGKLEDIKPDGVVGIASIAVSPDGSTVGYSIKSTDGVFYAYSHENGHSAKLANNAYIMALGDGARFFYYIEPDEVKLHYAEGSRDRVIGTNVSSLLELNRDLTECLFDMNGITYYSVEGSAARPLISGTSVYATNSECESVQGGESCQTSVKDCTSLFGGVFYAAKSSTQDPDARPVYDLWYVDGLRHATALVKGAAQFSLINGRDSLACLVDNTVYVMDSDDPSTRRVICNNTYSFNAAEDGSVFYCIGYDLGLYKVTEGRNPELLAKNVIHSALTYDGKCLYIGDYTNVGSLHMYAGSGTSADIADNVYRVEAMPAMSIYYTGFHEDELGNKVCDIYVSKDGAAFRLAVEDALLSTEE